LCSITFGLIIYFYVVMVNEGIKLDIRTPYLTYYILNYSAKIFYSLVYYFPFFVTITLICFLALMILPVIFLGISFFLRNNLRYGISEIVKCLLMLLILSTIFIASLCTFKFVSSPYSHQLTDTLETNYMYTPYKHVNIGESLLSQIARQGNTVSARYFIYKIMPRITKKGAVYILCFTNSQKYIFKVTFCDDIPQIEKVCKFTLQSKNPLEGKDFTVNMEIKDFALDNNGNFLLLCELDKRITSYEYSSNKSCRIERTKIERSTVLQEYNLKTKKLTQETVVSPPNENFGDYICITPHHQWIIDVRKKGSILKKYKNYQYEYSRLYFKEYIIPLAANYHGFMVVRQRGKSGDLCLLDYWGNKKANYPVQTIISKYEDVNLIWIDKNWNSLLYRGNTEYNCNDARILKISPLTANPLQLVRCELTKIDNEHLRDIIPVRERVNTIKVLGLSDNSFCIFVKHRKEWQIIVYRKHLLSPMINAKLK